MLAENAIGPRAFRHDDVVTFFSGRTCEVNNTDAEGRLVADGVAHATADPSPPPAWRSRSPTWRRHGADDRDRKHHAAIFANDEATERAAVAAGRRTGDLHPLLHAPEFHRAEFASRSPTARTRSSRA